MVTYYILFRDGDSIGQIFLSFADALAMSHNYYCSTTIETISIGD